MLERQLQTVVTETNRRPIQVTVGHDQLVDWIIPQSIVTQSYNFPDYIKRAIDIGLAGALLAFLAIPMVLVALIVKLTSPGPLFYKHYRLGLGGRRFQCYKFRTMVVNADEILRNSPELLAQFDANFKLLNDPRLTKYGAILRKLSLDELPQLLNVLYGDLSLVGPRPIVPRELYKYGEFAKTLLSVKPGLGGMWQAYRTDNTTYDERVALDMYYIKNRSVMLDVKLIFMTAYGVFNGRGAC